MKLGGCAVIEKQSTMGWYDEAELLLPSWNGLFPYNRMSQSVLFHLYGYI